MIDMNDRVQLWREEVEETRRIYAKLNKDLTEIDLTSAHKNMERLGFLLERMRMEAN